MIARAGGIALLLLGIAGVSHAASTLTPSGTTINNAATLTYQVGGVTQNTICSSPTGNSTSTCVQTAFKVDTKIDLTVSTSDAAPGISAVPGTTSTLTFVVTNLGNSTQDFAFSITRAPTTGAGGSVAYMFNGTSTSTVTDTFDPTSCTAYDTSSTPVLMPTYAGLTAGSSVTVKVACALPLGLTNNDVAAVTLVATAKASGGGSLTQSATNDPTVVDIVFADSTGTPEDATRDAQYSARSAYKISTAAVSVTKTAVTICDPANGDASGGYVPKSIPGAYVQYTVTIKNAVGSPAAAFVTSVQDTLQTANVTFDPDLIKGAGTSTACAAAGAGGTATSAANSGFEVVWTGGTRTSFSGGPKFVTTGTAYSAPNVNLALSSLLPVENGYTTAAGQLNAGDQVQVIYNVKIN